MLKSISLLIIAVLVIVIIIPIWLLLNFFSKDKSETNNMCKDLEQQIASLENHSEKLLKRVENLEVILKSAND